MTGENQVGPVFVVGNSRSGTTMTAQIFGMHPQIFAFSELHFFEQIWTPDAVEKALNEHDAARLASRLLAIQREGYLEYTNPDKYLDEGLALARSIATGVRTELQVFRAFLYYETSKAGKSLPCEQTPRNVFYIGEILEKLPGARFINLVRDPRAVLLSQKNKWKLRFQGMKDVPLREAIRSKMNYHPITISKLWNSSIGAADRFESHPNVYSLRFEDLLENPVGKVSEVCRFLNVEFHPEMLEISYWGSSREKTVAGQKGIKKQAATAWREGDLSPTEMYLCQLITRETAERHGYQMIQIAPNLLNLVGWIVFFPFHMTIALLLNLTRMRKLISAVWKRL